MPVESGRPPRIAGVPCRLRAAGAWAGRRAILLAPMALTACDGGVLDPRGAIGSADRAILVGSVAIMLAIVVPTIAATLGFAWWFRAANKRAIYLPDFEYSGRIEMIVWSIPLLTIMLLGGVAWIGSHQLDPAQPLPSDKPPFEVQVVSLDWKWLFIYPQEGIASVNRLVVPAGVPVHFSLTSGSVMTAFFVPQLGSMIYTMNGMRTQLHLQADAPGTFKGLASHFSGDGFSDMHFDTEAVSAVDFAAWATSVRQAGPDLDAPHYLALARQGVEPQPYTFRSADPTLFPRIVTQQLPPGPGPEVGRPLPSVSPRTRR